ncbi:MAG: hypothetical protein Q4E59_02415 [Bacteroidales bacterium]|nr:hypothetical protein [Bacteroidales bacterium]
MKRQSAIRRHSGLAVKRVLSRLLALLFVAGMTSCGTDVDDLYSSHAAYFYYSHVTTTTPLFTALNNPGMFCRIHFSNTAYTFEGCDGTSYSYTPTTADTYRSHDCLDGFIVGTPAVADLTGSSIVAYDLACPNCYEEYYITRRLTFSTTSTVYCSRCKRTYDLNNSGIVTDEGGGTSLFRYRITYSTASTGIMLIQN